MNKDLIIRNLYIPYLHKNAAIIYIEPMVDVKKVEELIIEPLINSKNYYRNTVYDIENLRNIVSIQNTEIIPSFYDIIYRIINGDTVIIVDTIEEAIVASTTGYAFRAIQDAQDEKVIKGPKEAFTENDMVNRSLIRKRIRDKNLVTEELLVGARSKRTVSILYIKDLASNELLTTVKERIENIEVDNLQDISLLEQLIEDRPKSLVPTVLYSERPDRAVAYLEEGHIILLMAGSPACLITPTTFWSFFHSSEDHNLKFMYGNFSRIIRALAFFITLFTPAIYIAITNYHPEMLPSDLLLAVAGTREKVPFPAIVEVLLMELAFEILREAGVRIPNPIGPTIGIVGALILGQAAVEATLVSPIMVIVISITGLSSFAISDVSFNYMLRISRFLFTLSAAAFGIFGMTIMFLIIYSYLVVVESFGVPYLSPFAPHNKSSEDTFIRKLLSKEKLRPSNIKPKDVIRQK